MSFSRVFRPLLLVQVQAFPKTEIFFSSIFIFVFPFFYLITLSFLINNALDHGHTSYNYQLHILEPINSKRGPISKAPLN